MDPLRIAVRVVFAYVFLLLLTRLAGHRAVKQADLPCFILGLVIGDLCDDLFFADVSLPQFIVAATTLFALHLRHSAQKFRSGSRNWRRAAHLVR